MVQGVFVVLDIKIIVIYENSPIGRLFMDLKLCSWEKTMSFGKESGQKTLSAWGTGYLFTRCLLTKADV